MGGQSGTTMVRVLGAVHVATADGSVIDLPSASQRRLLGLLALHAPRRLRSEWLADVLNVSPGALRTTVSRVRSAIGSDVLATASTGYALLCDVDATRFCIAVGVASESPDRLSSLAHAVALWTGPVLEEFRGEPWAEGEIARLTEIHASTVDDYADALISAKRPAEAIALLEGQVRDYRYRDRSRGLLIRALASAGRQAEALRAFRDYRELVTDEVGTEPSPDVTRIERRVATGWDGREPEFGSESHAMAPQRRPGTAIPPPSEIMHGLHFVGRTAELDVLRSEAAQAFAGGLRCVILEGEAGIGKTSILGAFTRSAGPGVTVLYGRCDETGVPLEPFRSIITSCMEHVAVEVLIDHVARCGGELTRISRSLVNRVPTAPEPTESDDAMERFLTFTAVADLLQQIAAHGPLIVMVDDLQWAEPTALLLLRHLTRSLARAPVLLVASLRSPVADAGDVRLALADLDRAQARHLPLAGLDAATLADLVTTTANVDPGPAVIAALADQTAGNPLYASQLIRHWVDIGRMGSGDVPPNLRDVVWSRVHALGKETAAVLAAASVIGAELYEDVLVETLDLPERTVTSAIDAAIEAGLLVDLPSVRRSFRFVHVLVANALYSQIGPSRRALLHARAAHALANNVEVVSPDLMAQLVRHSSLGGLTTEALQWSVSAGDYALDHLAPIEAARHYGIAVKVATELGRAEPERADLLVRLGDALHRAGDPAALATLESGAELARRSGQRDALIRAAFAADRGFIRLDSGAPAYLSIVEAAVAAADKGDAPTYSRLLALLAECLMYTPDHRRRLALAHEALALVDASGHPTLLAYVAPAAIVALWEPGSGRLRGDVAARAVLAAEASGDPRLEFSARLAAYNIAIESADPALAVHHLTKLRAIAHRVSEPRLRWILGIYETFEATMAARLAEAEALASSNLELGLQIGMPDALTFFAGQFFVVGTFAGRHAELEPLLEQAVSDNPGVQAFRLAYGIVCAATGRKGIAQEILDEGAASGFAGLPLDNLWMTSVIGHAILAIELDDADSAGKLLPLISPFADEVAFNGATSQGPVAAYVGKLASLLGLHDLAEDHLRAALDLATAFGWTYHQATTLLALAQARQRRLGSLDAEGRSWLSGASEMCRDGGFRNWIGQIDALATAQPEAIQVP